MDKHVIGVRVHDLNHGMVVVASGLISMHCRKTKLMGATAQLCSIMCGQPVIQYQHLLVAAAEVSIDENLLDKALGELQSMDFARIIRRGGEIDRVEVTIPMLRDRYEDIGRRWEELDPTEIEQMVVNDLSLMPCKATHIKEKYNLDENTLDIIRDIGRNSGALGHYLSPTDGQEVWYSPIYWEENPNAIFKLAQRFPEDRISKAFQEVRQHQGMSQDHVSDQVLVDAIVLGCLPTPAVESTGGRKHFLFTPIEGLKMTEKVIGVKAMAIVSCVRYGQEYAQITRIKFAPEVILQALLDKRQIGPHSEILTQYSPLVKLGVGRIEKAPFDMYTFHLIDTEENIGALQLAIALVTIGEPPFFDKDMATARQLVLPGSWDHPTKVRVTHRRSATYSSTTSERIHLIISGVSPDVIE
jgi:hypothetical protein